MAKPRYYEPGIIKPHPRVKHGQLDLERDEYVGQAADLIEAGVLTPGTVPAGVSASWRPVGVERETGQGLYRLPGFMKVTKVVNRGYRVVLTVSSEEQAARRREMEQAEVQSQTPLETQRRETRGLKDADAFREIGCWYGQMIERFVQNGCDGFQIALDDQEDLLELAGELQELLRSARVVDTRRRQHLTLAWSA